MVAIRRSNIDMDPGLVLVHQLHRLFVFPSLPMRCTPCRLYTCVSVFPSPACPWLKDGQRIRGTPNGAGDIERYASEQEFVTSHGLAKLPQSLEVP